MSKESQSSRVKSLGLGIADGEIFSFSVEEGNHLRRSCKVERGGTGRKVFLDTETESGMNLTVTPTMSIIENVLCGYNS